MRNQISLRRLAVLLSAILMIALSWQATLGDPAAAQPSDPATMPVQKTAKGGTKYSVALPKGWNPRTAWPILVYTNGGCMTFSAVRGDLPFIIVAPSLQPGGRDPNDLPALLACVEDVQKNYNGMPKFFITGWSTGGHLVWQTIFYHPEFLAAAAPAAGNYRGRLINEDDISKAKERVDLPIHAFQGDKDAAKVGDNGLDAQWADAEKVARAHGYKNLSREIVEGAGHEPFPRPVMDYFVTVLKGKATPAGSGSSTSKPASSPAAKPATNRST